MRRPIGAAVIGLGIGRSHAAAYDRLEESRLVAVCDVNAERRAAAVERYGCRGYDDMVALLSDDEVEVVSVATPHPTHAPLAIQAMEAGKHVVVEKPMTLGLADADALIATSERTGRALGVVHQRRLWPAARRAKDAIAFGKIGAVIRAECALSWWRNEAYYGLDPWRGRWETEGGGILVNQAVHAIDLMLWLVGEPLVEVWARWANLTHPYIEVEDNVVAAVRFASGALATFQASSSTRLSELRVTVHGANGATISVVEQPEGAVGYNPIWTVPGEEDVSLQSTREHLEACEFIYEMRAASSGHWWPTDYAYRRAADPPYHERYLREYLTALAAGCPPPVDPREARRAVEMIAAIYESARTGQTVTLPLAGA